VKKRAMLEVVETLREERARAITIKLQEWDIGGY